MWRIRRGIGVSTKLGKRLAIIHFVLLLIAATLTTASAFSDSPEEQPPPPSEVRLSAEDDGRLIELTEGQVLAISLESSPSTGYTWQVTEADSAEEGGGIVRQTSEIEFDPDSLLLGAPGMQTLRFEPLAKGQTTLQLVYRRLWEDAEPIRSFSVRVQCIGTFTEPASPKTSASAAALAESPVLEDDDPKLGLPEAFNWCDQGGCTPVRDQGFCGSCWAFATVGALESNIKIQDGLQNDLSEQYLVSCNTEGWGCDGGWWAHNYHSWKIPPGEPDAGAVGEADFPYSAKDDPCGPPHSHQEKIHSWHYIGNGWSVPSAADVKQAILDYGPVSVAVCVGPGFQRYSGGVFETHECTLVNHAVVLVGWDDSQGAQGVWSLRNSWGAGWGEGGYMRIGYGTSNVGYGANYVNYSPAGCYNLLTRVSPAGSGTITADPTPNCGFARYEPGTDVELTASANAAWHFTGWSDDASGGGNPTSITMDSNKVVTANYRLGVCAPGALLPLGLTGYWLGRRRRLRRN